MGFDSQTAGELHGRLRDRAAVKLYVALVRGDLRESFQYAASSTAVKGGDCVNSNYGVDMSDNGDRSIIGSFGRVPTAKSPDRRKTNLGKGQEAAKNTTERSKSIFQ